MRTMRVGRVGASASPAIHTCDGVIGGVDDPGQQLVDTRATAAYLACRRAVVEGDACDEGVLASAYSDAHRHSCGIGLDLSQGVAEGQAGRCRQFDLRWRW